MLSGAKIWGILIAVGALAAAFLWYGSYEFNQGRLKERGIQVEKLIEKDKEMAELRRTHESELTKIIADHRRSSARADARIAGLIAKNEELRKWWEAAIPADAVAYAWSLPDDDSSSPVPGGSQSDSGDRSGRGATEGG